jgi:lipooligosaccharide transport system permease protein
MADSAPARARVAPRTLRWLSVWRRNLLVWRKLAVPSLIGNFGEPLLYLLALGYGLGSLVGRIEGMPYTYYLASGIFCSSAMVTASFEATYSAYSRMAVQKTWEAIVTTPLDVFDVAVGEIIWGATKSLFSATAILIVGWSLGAVGSFSAVLAIPVALLAGLCFAAMAMVVTALLCVTPMLLICGVFFPITQMPEAVQRLAWSLPLTHAVALARPLIIGESPENALLHVAVLAAYGLVALVLATTLLRRRLDA